jgi:DNA/RNA endonuclease YhcR with UshA esterase domain
MASAESSVSETGLPSPGSSGHCPSCGRFVGPYERCPYCGADVGRRMAVRVFKVGSLALAIAGLAVLLLIARQSQAPTVRIGNLSGTMNWAYVRVVGVLTRQPAYDTDAGTLRLWVGDGTGEMMVTAYRSEAEWLIAHDLVPVMGDGVTLEGTLRIKEDFQYLVLDVPQHTEIQPAEAVELPIAEVNAGRSEQKVTVRGVIRDDRVPYDGLRILTLRDESGKIDVTLPTEAAPITGVWPELRVGQPVQATGALDHYKGTPQISVGRSTNLVVLDATVTIAPERRTGELSAAATGQMAAVEGFITQIRPFSAGVKLALDDGSGEVTLLLWQDLYDSLAGGEALVEGMQIRALGEIAEYQGELELVPELPSDVVVTAAAEPVVSERKLGELAPGDLGQMVRVEGVLKSLRPFSAGVKGILDDSTGTVTLLLWQDVYDSLPDPASLVPGAVLRVEGEVTEYLGELEVVPRAAAGVSTGGWVELPQEEVAIGQLTVDDLGQTVRVDSRIVERVPFSKGMKYTLDDGTGTITLLLWQNLYEGLQDPAALTVTVQLSVRGEVAEYQGDLELVPQFPSDIEIISIADPPSVTPTLTLTPTATPTTQPTTTATSQPTTTPAAQPTTTPSPQPSPSPVPQPISGITTGEVGQMALVDARIVEVDYFSRGVQYTLDDGTGRIILLVWQNVLEAVPSHLDLFPGSQVRVRGEIQEYQGDLEIIPQRGKDVLVITPGERLPIEERAVSDVTPADEGRIFVVAGTVTRIEGRGWLRIWIQDGTGELLIFVPEREAEYLPAGIGAGVRLRVTGEVDIYQGQLEIIPLAGADVEVQ